MSFRNPYLLFVSIVGVVGGIGFIVLNAHKQKNVFLAHLSTLKTSKTFADFQQKSRLWSKIRLALLVCILLIMGVLAAQPYTWSTVKQASDASDIMIVVDASSSVEPYFKTISSSLRQFLNDAKGNRVGLVIIAGRPQLLVPPTVHYERLERVADDLGVMNSEQFLSKWSQVTMEGSAIGDAIVLATDSFGDDNPRQKLVTIFSDGINNKGSSIEEITNYPVIRNVTVISAFVSSPDQSSGNGTAMKLLSEKTAGEFVEVDKPQRTSQALAAVKKKIVTNPSSVVYREVPAWFIVGSILLLSGLVLIDKVGSKW